MIELRESPFTTGGIAVGISGCGAEPGTFSDIWSPGDWSVSQLELVGLVNADLLLPELSPSLPGLIGSVRVNHVSLPLDLPIEPNFPKCYMFSLPIEVLG